MDKLYLLLLAKVSEVPKRIKQNVGKSLKRIVFDSSRLANRFVNRNNSMKLNHMLPKCVYICFICTVLASCSKSSTPQLETVSHYSNVIALSCDDEECEITAIIDVYTWDNGDALAIVIPGNITIDEDICSVTMHEPGYQTGRYMHTTQICFFQNSGACFVDGVQGPDWPTPNGCAYIFGQDARFHKTPFTVQEIKNFVAPEPSDTSDSETEVKESIEELLFQELKPHIFYQPSILSLELNPSKILREMKYYPNHDQWQWEDGQEIHSPPQKWDIKRRPIEEFGSFPTLVEGSSL